jgi:hypothetical protein
MPPYYFKLFPIFCFSWSNLTGFGSGSTLAGRVPDNHRPSDAQCMQTAPAGTRHTERFHQGLGGQLIKGQPGSANDNGSNGSIVRRSRLGGLLNYYHREAA